MKNIDWLHVLNKQCIQQSFIFTRFEMCEFICDDLTFMI